MMHCVMDSSIHQIELSTTQSKGIINSVPEKALSLSTSANTKEVSSEASQFLMGLHQEIYSISSEKQRFPDIKMNK